MSNSSGGGGQPSCTTVPLGKSVRRALRAAIGRPKRKDKPARKKKKKGPDHKDSGGVSMELSGSSVAAARREAVVRVVLRGGVEEVYPGVVLACTVIRNHPPGLCLAHPDVFRNPHGAVVRPMEPLFPGQKFLLIPWSTVVKLKQRIPESSIGAFADDQDEGEEEEEEEEEVTSTEASSDDNSGGAASSEEWDGGSSSSSRFTSGCSAREYYEAQERWSACRFQKMVERGLAVAPSKEPAERSKDKATRKKKGTKNKRKGPKKRRGDRLAAPPGGLVRAFAAPRRAAWEPSLPSVDEEEDDVVSSSRHDQEAPEDEIKAHGQQ